MKNKITCFVELVSVSEAVRVNIAVANDYMCKQYSLDNLEQVLNAKLSINAILSTYSWDFGFISDDDYFKISKELDNYFRSLVSEWSKIDLIKEVD